MSASDRCLSNRQALPEVPSSCSSETSAAAERAGRSRSRRKLLALSSLVALLMSTAASAQETPPLADPAAPAPAAEPIPEPVAPAVPEPVVVEPTPQPPPAAVVTVAPVEERATEPPTVAEPAFSPKLTIGVGLRTGLSFAVNPGDQVTFSLSDSLDQLMFRPFFAAQLTNKVGMFVQLNAGASRIDIIDAYFDLKLVDEFQILLGQHIPANDRNNFSGPFFNNSWNFAAVPSFPFDAAARDRGFTFWGLLASGIIKYHLSMVDLEPGREIGKARFAGRLNFNFLDKETSYYASDTYFGKQDTLAIGALVSYQDGMSSGQGVTDKNMDGKIENDFLGFAADALFEKNLGAGGTITLQAGYWNWDGTGADYVVNQGSKTAGSGFVGALGGNVTGQSYQVAASWLSATKLGSGQLQPNLRVQGFDKDAGDTMIYDVGIGYIINGFNHLWRLNYRHVDNPGGGKSVDEDSLQLGAQLQI